MIKLIVSGAGVCFITLIVLAIFGKSLTLDTSDAIIDVGIGGNPVSTVSMGDGTSKVTYRFVVGHPLMNSHHWDVDVLVSESMTPEKVREAATDAVSARVKELGWSNNDLNLTWK